MRTLLFACLALGLMFVMFSLSGCATEGVAYVQPVYTEPVYVGPPVIIERRDRPHRDVNIDIDVRPGRGYPPPRMAPPPRPRGPMPQQGPRPVNPGPGPRGHR